jgi:hypothetical protein
LYSNDKLRGVFEMATNLAKYIKQERVKQGLNYAELSRLMGYKNNNRGMRRIIDLAREGKVHSEILKKLIEALGLDRAYIDQLIKEDKDQQRREFEEWVNNPIDWHLIIRWMPAVYGEREIPGYIKTEDEAIEYARSVDREYKSMVWLVLSMKENIHIDSDGSIKYRKEVTMEHSWLSSTELR